MQCYPLRLFSSHAVVCGCPPTVERDVIQTLHNSSKKTFQLAQPISFIIHLLIQWFVLGLTILAYQMASCKPLPIHGWSERTHH